MKRIYLILAALTAILLTACTNNESLINTEDIIVEKQDVPIQFGLGVNNMTRADFTGAVAAEKLGGKFVVTGYKGSSTATVGNIVFDNYLVEYAENTAHTSESNTSNWEYVGKTPIAHATANGITKQTIKFWDYSKAQYDFIAWSTGSKTAVYDADDLADGKVLVSAITPATATGTGAGKVAYTFEGKAADLSECYIADLVTVKKASYGDDPVTIRFRQLGTKVRIGIYETVPGYSVKDVKFYEAAQTALPSSSPENARIFTTTANDIYTEGTYTVTFPTVDNTSSADNNKAHVAFAPKSGVDQTTTINWGTLNYTTREDGETNTGNAYLGRTSNTASYAGSSTDNYYVIYLPNETGTNLNLRVDFTLESTDGSGEEIVVKGARAQVPSIYTTWKPGYAYTYLFKISDKTNGSTGSGYDPTDPTTWDTSAEPAGLYPITFDALVVNAEEDATPETITTISTPSITTYQQGSNVTNKDEYNAGSNKIYVTVNEDDALVALTDATAKLYTLEAGHTEADVVDALSIRDDATGSYTIKGRNGLELTEVTAVAPATTLLTSTIVSGPDGNDITLTAPAKALEFTPSAGSYAFVYVKTAPTVAGTVDQFEPVTKEVGDDVTGLYRYKYNTAVAGDVQTGVDYYTLSGLVYSPKAPVFLGQNVSNLYTRTGAGTTEDPYVYTAATGNAVTGTTYYYTTDAGATYTAAHAVDYADFASAALYTDVACTVSKTDSEPVSGKAYYYDNSGTGVFCVVYPEQTTGFYVLDTTQKEQCADTEVAVGWQAYFDKYAKNNGEYYTKIIKVAP